MKIMLFTLPTCSYCVPAKELLKDKKEVEIINLKDHEELAVKYGIRSVPALVVEECCGSVTTYVGLDKIEKFVQEKMKTESSCSCGK